VVVVGKNVRQIRLQKGLSQTDLKSISGVGQDSISGIESGKHRPRPSTLRKLAAALGVEVEDFYKDPQRPKSRSDRGRIVEELLSLPFEARMALLENIEKRNEPFDSTVTDRLSEALIDVADNGTTLDITLDKFFNFLTYASAEEAREVLFAGATTEGEKREVADKFTLAITRMIREGRLATQDAVERLAVATQLQVKTA
jgi:transcriptional regulator with XRE-family HTH domain